MIAPVAGRARQQRLRVGRLSLDVLAASRLPVADLGGTSDPYVVATLTGISLSQLDKKAVAGAVKETSQGTFAKGVDTKWPETQTVAKGVTSLLPRKSEDIFLFKENASVPPRG